MGERGVFGSLLNDEYDRNEDIADILSDVGIKFEHVSGQRRNPVRIAHNLRQREKWSRLEVVESKKSKSHT